MSELNWSIVNVVYYDGTDAYVSKFVLRTDENGNVDDESQHRTCKYLRGNGEIVHYDAIRKVNFEEILYLKESPEAEYRAAYERFKTMWFEKE